MCTASLLTELIRYAPTEERKKIETYTYPKFL